MKPINEMTDEERLAMVEATKKQLSRFPGLTTPKEELKIVSQEILGEIAISPLRLKRENIGNFRIGVDFIPANEPMIVVSRRDWLMTGYRPTKVALPFPRVIHRLLEADEDGWQLRMTDSPEESFQQYAAYKAAKVRVLVGGLGLGLYATMVAMKNEVTEVVVVELEEDVIELTNPHNPNIKVIHGDFFKFIEETEEEFDYIYVDIHYSMGVTEYCLTVKPIRKILGRRFPDIPVSLWAEENMLSQYNPDGDWEKHLEEKSR